MAGNALALAAEEIEVSELHHVDFVGWYWEGEDEGAGSGVSELAIIPDEAGVCVVGLVEMMDATFDGASDGGCQGCVGFWEVCGRDLDGSAGHFVGKGFPGVGLVGGSAVCGLKDEVDRGEVI